MYSLTIAFLQYYGHMPTVRTRKSLAKEIVQTLMERHRKRIPSIWETGV